MRTKKSLRNTIALSLLAALAGTAGLAQAEQVWARVVSATPLQETPGTMRYSVIYEYGGQRYTTITDTHPGASIPIEVGGYGVATPSPVAPQPEIVQGPVEQGQPDWNGVAPEPGVVISGSGAPAYGQPMPVYTQPAPYYAPAPVYVGPAYYPQPYFYPPVGLSLNLGYSRGWGGGWRHGHHGRWR